MDAVHLPLLIRDTAMKTVTGTTRHHTHPTSTPGMVAMTTTLTDMNVVQAQLQGEIEMQVHTLDPVFASSPLKDMLTPTQADRETSISYY